VGSSHRGLQRRVASSRPFRSVKQIGDNRASWVECAGGSSRTWAFFFLGSRDNTWDIFTGGQSLRTHPSAHETFSRAGMVFRTHPSTHETFSREGRVYAHIQVHMRHFHGRAEFTQCWKCINQNSKTTFHFLSLTLLLWKNYETNANSVVWLFEQEQLGIGWREGVNCPFPHPAPC
jgi:hypothetical protein